MAPNFFQRTRTQESLEFRTARDLKSPDVCYNSALSVSPRFVRDVQGVPGSFILEGTADPIDRRIYMLHIMYEILLSAMNGIHSKDESFVVYL